MQQVCNQCALFIFTNQNNNTKALSKKALSILTKYLKSTIKIYNFGFTERSICLLLWFCKKAYYYRTKTWMSILRVWLCDKGKISYLSIYWFLNHSLIKLLRYIRQDFSQFSVYWTLTCWSLLFITVCVLTLEKFFCLFALVYIPIGATKTINFMEPNFWMV